MSISNTSQIPMLAGGFIDLDMITRSSSSKSSTKSKSSLNHRRRTKIICTIGPACCEISQLETMLDEGMDVARLDFSHGDHKSHAWTLEKIRKAAQNKQRQITIMMDIKGPGMRTGYLKDTSKKTVQLTKGETILLTPDLNHLGDSHKLAFNSGSSHGGGKPPSFQTGQSIWIDDGALVLTVLENNNNNTNSGREVLCRIENNATIGECAKMHIITLPDDHDDDDDDDDTSHPTTNNHNNMPTFTHQDIKDIVHFGIPHNVDFIAASCIRHETDVQLLRQLLADNQGQHIKIISKIDNAQALQNYHGILQRSDGIMISRGDLGMEISPSKVFLAQKYMIRKANVAGKPIITATQLLESMIQQPRPTRAECSDIANAVYDGTDGVLLGKETSHGPFGAKAIQVMAKTCMEAERSRNYHDMFQAMRNATLQEHGSLTTGESLASSAVKTVMDVQASFLVVLTETGTMARYVSKFRPACLVVCLTCDETVARQCSGLLSGCHFCFLVDNLEDSHALAMEVSHQAIKAGIAQEGELMVVVAGKMYWEGSTDQIRVETVTTSSCHKEEEEETSCNGTTTTKSPLYRYGRGNCVGHLNAGFQFPKQTFPS